MTTASLFTQKIMRQVATNEEERMKHALFLIIPLLGFFVFILAVTLKRSLTILSELEVLDVIGDLDFGSILADKQFIVLADWLWEIVEKQILLGVLFSTLALIIIAVKSDVLSYPHRFREASKYKN